MCRLRVCVLIKERSFETFFVCLDLISRYVKCDSQMTGCIFQFWNKCKSSKRFGPLFLVAAAAVVVVLPPPAFLLLFLLLLLLLLLN